MLSPKPQLSLRNAREYFREHLSSGDYYSAGAKVAGEWFGLGAEKLGLTGKVKEADFLALCEGLNPADGRRLTARTNGRRRTAEGRVVANRRVFYDFTISPPKSVSVVALMRDDRIVGLHDRAVRQAMTELEKYAATRVRKGGQCGDRETGNVVAAAFRHDTSRELDPHLHTHCVVLNATFDPVESRWKALEVSGMYRAQKFAENLYYHELCKGLRGLGYEIESNTRDFEIKGVPVPVIERFSKRHQQIDDEAALRLGDDGESKDVNAVRRQIAHDHRRRKQKESTAERLRPHWRSQLKADEAKKLAGLRLKSTASVPRADVADVVAWADEFLFERRSVVNDHELMAAALARGRGELFDLAALRNEVERHGYVREVERIAADTLPEHAIRIAEFRDESSGFGWGRTYDRRDGYFEYVITTPAEARSGLAALPLAVSNSATLLFASDEGGVPGALDRYAFKQRADWFVTPAEGPFRHFFVVGDRVTYAAQARLDFALEKGPYASAGPDALGAMEGLAIVFIALGFAGAILVWCHAARLLPDLMPTMRIAWAFTALLVPILGVVLYFAAHRRPTHPPDEEHTNVRFMRPPSIQSAAATAMGFGYGAPLMVAIGFLFAYFGFPLFYGRWAEGASFLFGAGMPIMMFGMWAGAIAVAWLCAQAPMMKMMMPKMATKMRYRRTLGITTISMTAVSLGMMTSTWVLQMAKLPMMPKEDEILFFGALWLASAVGFLVAWPLNYPLVRTGWKMGGA